MDLFAFGNVRRIVTAKLQRVIDENNNNNNDNVTCLRICPAHGVSTLYYDYNDIVHTFVKCIVVFVVLRELTYALTPTNVDALSDRTS